MLSAALDQLGLDLGITLPGDFRRELADPAVHEAFRSAMLDANPKLAGDDAVGDTVARLRQGNRGFRASARWRGWEDQTQGMPEGSDGEKAWPRHWFWVGGNFSG